MSNVDGLRMSGAKIAGKERARESASYRNTRCVIELSCAFVAITWEIGSSR
jgi:hypothetical protein